MPTPQPKACSDRANDGSFWGMLVTAISIFVATLVYLMQLAETPLTQAWLVGLLGLAALLPCAIWLAVVLHYDGWTPRPWPLVMLALAWGSLIAIIAAFRLETASEAILIQWGVPSLNRMIVGPFIEEAVKGLFIVLLYVFVQRYLRGPWNGLFYGVLVGTGFGFTENLAHLILDLDIQPVSDRIAGLVSTYLVREVFTSHLHPMFTAATGMAAGMAARQRLPAAQAFRWILCGFLIAWTLHALNNSVPYTTWIVAPVSAAIWVIALWRLRRRETLIAQREPA